MIEERLKPGGALAAEEDKLLACIHCGLCLEACPTYVHTGDENDSPRGRIYLMRAFEEGRLAASSVAFTRHIDRCLGCRACESACPAGVEYGQLLEAARSDIAAQGRPKGWTSRMLRFILRRVWLHPSRLRLALNLARLMRDSGAARLLLKLKVARLASPRAEFALALLESSKPVAFVETEESDNGRARTKRTTPSDAPLPNDLAPRARSIPDSAAAMTDETDDRDGLEPTTRPTAAQLFSGCVMESLFARVNRATTRVLEANGCRVSVPKGQVCCGALHAHAGDLEGARILARRNLDAFEDAAQAPVVTNAGGCGAMLLSYAHLLKDDELYGERAERFSRRVRDISQQLEETGTRRGASLEAGRTTYDASCHLLHGQRAVEAPHRIFGSISGLEFVPLEGEAVCCGGAGVYNLLEPELSARVLEEKLAHVAETGAQMLATGNPGCHMQIGAGALLKGISLSVCHPVEVLDESYRRAGFYDEATRAGQE
ncbi:MAG TPA: heterodisulfide reductase-related iron-sulfur binding cluster [Pyrinomonadaceae bacterium]|jgi:glycolate oxidase iron-sulfur subunit